MKVHVTMSLTVRAHDALKAAAREQNTSVSGLIERFYGDITEHLPPVKATSERVVELDSEQKALEL